MHLPVFYPLLSICAFKNGYTALMIAVQNGYYRTVEALLEMGADIHAVDKVRHTVRTVQYSTVQYSTVQYIIMPGTQHRKKTIRLQYID